ncbi:hypothetical protein BOX15_Mlig019357g1, partial [Macrostomum lignano]
RDGLRASASQHGSQPNSFSEMRQGSVACPFCPRRFCRTRAAVAQYLRHVRSHGMGCDSEPEEAAATNSEAVRAAAVQQVASRNESAMQPCADGSHAVTKRHECESVGKTRATKSAATRYRRAQGVQRPFQCDACQKKFSKKSNLIHSLGHLICTCTSALTLERGRLSARCAARDSAASAATSLRTPGCTQEKSH